jgi:hypothetical protein
MGSATDQANRPVHSLAASAPLVVCRGAHSGVSARDVLAITPCGHPVLLCPLAGQSRSCLHELLKCAPLVVYCCCSSSCRCSQAHGRRARPCKAISLADDTHQKLLLLPQS